MSNVERHYVIVEVFQSACGGCGSVLHHLWRSWKGSPLHVERMEVVNMLVEGMEVFHTSSGAWKCSTLPMGGMEVFHTAHGGRGSVSLQHGGCRSVPSHFWRVWKVPYAMCEEHGSVFGGCGGCVSVCGGCGICHTAYGEC